MKYCSRCGNELFDEAVICPKCGSAVKMLKAVGDSRSKAWALVGFLFPILGIILWLVWRDDRPLRSKSIMKGICIKLCVDLVILIIVIVLLMITGFVSCMNAIPAVPY